MLYAAYGSNLHPLRLAARTPSAEYRGAAHVPGFRLHWDKRGRDGSGKCNIRPADGGIFVAVYELDDSDVAALDLVEGNGSGYVRGELDVPGFGNCASYFADEDWVDESLAPFCWYRELVMLGCVRHGFPADYRAAIEAVRFQRDPDQLRREDQQQLVTRLLLDVAESLR